MEDKSVEIILFEQIQSALSNLITNKIIRSVEIWNSQIDNEQRERPRLYPYVAVQIDTSWGQEEAMNSISNIAQNVQKGDCTVIIHYIYSSLLNETDSWLAEKAISHNIHRVLNGLNYDSFFSSLFRINTQHEISHDRVGDVMITYSTKINECAITDSEAEVIAAGDWTIEAQNNLIIDNDTIRSGSLYSEVVDPITGEITFSSTSGNGQLNILDGATGVINIGTSKDSNIKINVVVNRNLLAYSITLDVVNNSGVISLSTGEYNPFIESNPNLDILFTASLVDDIIKLNYDNQAGLGATTIYYVYNKIL